MINTNLQDIVNHLTNDLLIEPEALVWLHSGVIGMGVVKGGVETITNAFEKVLASGALVIPTFTYSWCNGESFDPNRSECPDVGAYAQEAWKDNRFIRNNNPNFSVAVMDNTDDGVVKNEICDGNCGGFSVKLENYNGGNCGEANTYVVNDVSSNTITVNGSSEDSSAALSST